MSALEFMGHHPVLTFFLFALVVLAVDNIIANICRTIRRKP